MKLLSTYKKLSIAKISLQRLYLWQLSQKPKIQNTKLTKSNINYINIINKYQQIFKDNQTHIAGLEEKIKHQEDAIQVLSKQLNEFNNSPLIKFILNIKKISTKFKTKLSK